VEAATFDDVEEEPDRFVVEGQLIILCKQDGGVLAVIDESLTQDVGGHVDGREAAS
jgi:hypothetical protein